MDGLADLTLQPQYNLLCGFSLLVENWLCLATIARLLAIVSPFTCKTRCIRSILLTCMEQLPYEVSTTFTPSAYPTSHDMRGLLSSLCHILQNLRLLACG